MGEWLEVWTRRFIKDNVINGRLMNTDRFLKIPVEQDIGKTAKLHCFDLHSIPPLIMFVKQCIGDSALVEAPLLK